MLRFFKTGHPAALLLLLVYSLIFHLPILLGSDILILDVPQAPLSKLILTLIIGINWLHYIITALIVWIQALWVNSIVMQYKWQDNRDYLAALIFVILNVVFSGTLALTEPKLANFALIWMLDRLFLMYRKERAFGQAFDIGLALSLASLCYLPALFLLPALIIALIVLRPFIWQEWALMSAGLVVPYYLGGTILFMLNSPGQIWADHFATLFSPREWMWDIGLGDGLLLALWVLVTILALFHLQRVFLSSVIQMRNYIQVALSILLFSILALVLDPNPGVIHITLLCVILTLLWSRYIAAFKKDWIPEIGHVVLAGSILFMQYV